MYCTFEYGFLVTDAYSKYLQVHVKNTSTSAVTIDSLRKSFSYLGLPKDIVSDNFPEIHQD